MLLGNKYYGEIFQVFTKGEIKVQHNIVQFNCEKAPAYIMVLLKHQWFPIIVQTYSIINVLWHFKMYSVKAVVF